MIGGCWLEPENRKFNKLAFREGHKISQGKRKRENEVFVCICFEMIGRVAMLIANSGIYI